MYGPSIWEMKLSSWEPTADKQAVSGSDWAADEELGAEATRNPKHRTADAKILSLSCILEMSKRPSEHRTKITFHGFNQTSLR